jgi:predicted phosphoribosyltransferase
MFNECSGRSLNRQHAGQVLATHLASYAGRGDLVVLGLPRGGIPVAHEVARSLGARLDVFVVRKLGAPQQPELAMGAIASGGIRVLNDDVVRAYRIPPEVIEVVARREAAELARRERIYRNGRPAVSIEGTVVVLVDDGLATGSTMRAALAALRCLNPSRVIVAARWLERPVRTSAGWPTRSSARGYRRCSRPWASGKDFDQTTDEGCACCCRTPAARASHQESGHD